MTDVELDDACFGLAAEATAEYGTGPEEECFCGCGRTTTRWVHAMTSYPLHPNCMTQAQREAGLQVDIPP